MPEELKRGFGYWTILALAIGSLLGTTIFFGAPIGAKYSGNMLLVAWVILSVMALYISSVFGELSAMFPKTGGAYEFGKQAYGKFVSFIIAWTAWLFGSITTVTIVIAAVNSLGLQFSDFQNFLLSVLIIVILNVIAYFGAEIGSAVMLSLGVVMVAIPAIIVAKGLTLVKAANFVPFASPELGAGAVFVTLFFMAEAYFGGESATYLAEETRNPTRVIPKAIMHATAIIGVLGLLMMVVTLGIIPWQQLVNVEAPVNEIAGLLFGDLGRKIAVIGIFVALLGTAISTVLSMPRLLLALARDRLFLGQFKELHPRFKTPHNAIMFQTVVLVMLLLLGSANYSTMLELLVPMAGVLYASIVLSVVVLRKKMPDAERPFKVPFSPIVPLLIVLFFATIIVAWVVTVPGASIFLNISFSLIAIGIPLYLLVELYYDPKMITEANDISAYVTFFFQKITGSGLIARRKVLDFLGDIKGKTVLDYGCNVGSLTLPLASAVGPKGKVYATHFSKNSVKITRKRLDLKKWQSETFSYANVSVIHDPEMMNRIPPQVGYVDAAVSIGILSYVQDIRKVLKELCAIMPVGGKLCLVEHTDFFHLIPNVEWLNNEKAVEKLFRESGFAIKVRKDKGLLWNTVYVYGIKFSGETPFI